MNISLQAVLKKLLLLFLVITGFYYAKVFLMPLCFGGILATLFLPFCSWLQQMYDITCLQNAHPGGDGLVLYPYLVGQKNCVPALFYHFVAVSLVPPL